MADRKAVIKNADMSEEMQQDAVDCATQALEKYNIEKVRLFFQLFGTPLPGTCCTQISWPQIVVCFKFVCGVSFNLKELATVLLILTNVPFLFKYLHRT